MKVSIYLTKHHTLSTQMQRILGVETNPCSEPEGKNWNFHQPSEFFMPRKATDPGMEGQN